MNWQSVLLQGVVGRAAALGDALPCLLLFVWAVLSVIGFPRVSVVVTVAEASFR